MSTDEQAPYRPQPGARSILAGISGDPFAISETREQRLARPLRAFTLDWLAWCVATATRRPVAVARQALIDGIPDRHESVLDGGGDFIFVVDQAAIVLGAEPEAVVLRPQQLHS